ncbi:multidrug efflux SMR transporter [Oceanobacillus luteolus]|uniref:DMT family transporter n=1 Tax=Oceanobacillus luteolus TaxID=1274358 RepID=A0ABW4HPS3_9BACI|nr:multidrug efflux SMR transporter [Oceanobacillus luteolus]MCM3740419.1 multidrug efflux SMR transporter [Oceanobacillus luteolus]
MNAYVLLIISILGEVFGSSLLKLTNGFKRIIPTLGVIIGYSIAFYSLSLTLTELPIGMVYAIWAGVGTALTSLVGVLVYKEIFNMKKLTGIFLIIAGVVLLNI